ncbi:superoxide dismutase family protein [Croceicoccus mobilis]|uniref:Superoxide dismutase [Cu-Zn] n=1 Tax=Croceicoccus mobilis TaxID=1703339 RepID=A0A916Z6P9_9SPHN|nr:superoxide dismutase family protein [Croceicoccus mobilis]GGD78616.1 superoxide dismutase [Cu-Zn] [Croceicoccus mobilis]
MKLSPKTVSLFAAASALALSACGEPADTTPETETAEPAEAPAQTATAMLKDTDGNDVGTATATETADGLAIALNVTGMPAGEHGAHIHTTGDCSAADFTSAGGHWNPMDVNHGTESEAPNPHAGDMPNLVVAEDGTGTLEATSNGTFAGLMDEDGSAFVVHANADDYMSQPSGDAGPRLACGVFTAG